ncbi:Catechol 2,3-dioxygenase [Soonwooa buanensis]|uniref:Catechol 2,3-dioxygenase n=1 Tax=Soonwooa buanensis TaxID=619805 RepID=A0A1T5CVX3_9FLAO|nr:VOC family protein [Soonwooa buanensis]SKB63360.1 Catechol 2,3-dioxygenase [Soonwooa buanensis]
MDLSENIIGFHHYSLKVNDFEKTLKFYESLGFEEVHSWSLPSFQLKKGMMIFNQRINCYIELFDRDAAIPTQGRIRKIEDEYVENAILHICFVVKDADLARKKAIENGAFDLSEDVLELELSNENRSVKVRNSLVYSPNGEVIEFLEEVKF